MWLIPLADVYCYAEKEQRTGCTWIDNKKINEVWPIYKTSSILVKYAFSNCLLEAT